MTTKDEAEQKEAPISDLEITGTLIQARDAMAPMRGLILFDQAIERINKLLAQQKEAQPEFDRAYALTLLKAASKSGDPGAIALASQLSGEVIERATP